MVSVLNRTVAAFFIIVLSTVFARPDEGRPTVRTLRVSRLSPSTIKPCQRVTALLELQLDRGATPKEWRRIIRRLSETVRVNGSEFRNRLTPLSGSNDACQFGLVDLPSEQNGNGKPMLRLSAEVVVDVFANLREQVCLFLEPGEYEIAFVVGEQTATVSVVVEEPTAEEAQIIEFVNDVEMLLYLMDPVELKKAPRKTMERLRQLARIDSDYSKMLSRAIGIGGVSVPRMPANWSEDEYKDRELALARETYSWLNSNCSDEINSPIEALAAYKCGLAAGMLASGEDNQRKANDYLQRREELWNRVAQSSMAFGESAKASQLLAQIRLEKSDGD